VTDDLARVRRALTDLARAVSSRDPLGRDYLATVRTEQAYTYDTVTPTPKDGWALSPFGMWLRPSEANPRGPLERALVFVRPEEVFGVEASYMDIITALKTVSQVEAVTFVASSQGESAQMGTPETTTSNW